MEKDGVSAEDVRKFKHKIVGKCLKQGVEK